MMKLWTFWMILALAILLLTYGGINGCAPDLYRLCSAGGTQGLPACSQGLTTEEATKAAKASDAWGDRSAVQLRANPEVKK